MYYKQNIEYAIKQFTNNYRYCDFVVVTGFLSKYGLSKLNDLIPHGRPITLIVGKIRTDTFRDGYTNEERVRDLQAISDRPIKVYNDTHEDTPLAHGKAIVAIHNKKIVAALVGSANLTKNGLATDYEIMVRCDPNDYAYLDTYIKLHAKENIHLATDRLRQIVNDNGRIKVSTKTNKDHQTYNVEPDRTYSPAYTHSSTTSHRDTSIRPIVITIVVIIIIIAILLSSAV